VVPTLPHDESAIDPRTSTPDQICRALLPWAENLLHLALGPGAEEYAGLGLVDAIRHFDTTRSVPFRKFAARRLVWTAREEMNRADGRAPGDPRRRHRRTSVSIDQTPGDRPLPSASLSYVPNPAARLEEHEAIAQSLRTADKLEGPARWVVLGRFLGDFNNHTLGRLLGRAPYHMHLFTADLRRSWRTD
jgi:hypothetical protein